MSVAAKVSANFCRDIVLLQTSNGVKKQKKPDKYRAPAKMCNGRGRRRDGSYKHKELPKERKLS